MKDQLRSIFQRFQPHLLPLLAIFVFTSIVFLPQYSGKKINQSDIDHSYRVTKESWDYYEKHGKRNLWTNSMFAGMPTFQSGGLQKKNLFEHLAKITTFFIKKPIGGFLFGCFSMYLLLVLLGIDRWLSALGAVALCFSTQLMIIYWAGHNSKLLTIFTFPLVLAGLHSLVKRRYTLGALLTILGVGLNLYRNHYQMSVYMILFFGIYFIIEGIGFVKQKDWKHLLKVAGICLAAGVLAMLCSMTRILTTLDYTPESIRGKQIVSKERGVVEPEEAEGVGWTFANYFAFDLRDLGAVIVPRFAGGGRQEDIGLDSDMARAIGNSAYQPKRTKISTYYGNQPFTVGAPYLGIVTFTLFLFGLFAVPGRWRIWAAICVLFSALYALGDNLSGFNKIFFNTIPLFNKFRAPGSILLAVAICFPLIACLGLQRLIDREDKKKMLKPLMIVGGILIAFLAVFLVAGPSILDMTHRYDNRFTDKGIPYEILQGQREIFLRQDLLRALGLVIAILAVLWLYIAEKINKTILIIAAAALLLFDIVSINQRYLDYSMYKGSTKKAGQFTPSPVDNQILQDQDPHYRVIDQTGKSFRNSEASYFHKSVGGYNAAKLRRFQDLIDFHLNKGRTSVYGMLNTKYIIKPGTNGQKYVEKNNRAMGNAWFVNNIQYVDNDKNELLALSNFEPSSTAIVHTEFAKYLEGLSPNTGGALRLTSYDPDELRYEYTSRTENLAVFSEMYYGPNKGWQAYIDDQPVDHIRVNYALRALRVPAGSHTIRFSFRPRSYYLGETISLIGSIVCGLILLFLIYLLIKNTPPLEKKKSIASATSAKSKKKKSGAISTKKKSKGKNTSKK